MSGNKGRMFIINRAKLHGVQQGEVDSESTSYACVSGKKIRICDMP